MKVYTRTGDKGTTGLLYGDRVSKSHPLPAAYGAVDEAVAALGIARAQTESGSELAELLLKVQRELFAVGAELATQSNKRDRLKPGISIITSEMVDGLEPIIDDLTTRFELRPEFVLPGEDLLSASLDYARTVIRRAERAAVAAMETGDLIDSQVVPYLNRLADLVYTMARWQEGQARPVRISLEES